MMDAYDKQAEELLNQFSDDWSPSCTQVRNGVAAALREQGKEIERLKLELSSNYVNRLERANENVDMMQRIEKLEAALKFALDAVETNPRLATRSGSRWMKAKKRAEAVLGEK
jgi:dsDNA-specific endonuclease/ATPase MutS2